MQTSLSGFEHQKGAQGEVSQVILNWCPKQRKKRKNCAGRGTFPTGLKEKGPHCIQMLSHKYNMGDVEGVHTVVSAYMLRHNSIDNWIHMWFYAQEEPYQVSKLERKELAQWLMRSKKIMWQVLQLPRWLSCDRARQFQLLFFLILSQLCPLGVFGLVHCTLVLSQSFKEEHLYNPAHSVRCNIL